TISSTSCGRLAASSFAGTITETTLDRAVLARSLGPRSRCGGSCLTVDMGSGLPAGPTGAAGPFPLPFPGRILQRIAPRVWPTAGPPGSILCQETRTDPLCSLYGRLRARRLGHARARRWPQDDQVERLDSPLAQVEAADRLAQLHLDPRFAPELGQ